jgi:HEAT repeat protein
MEESEKEILSFDAYFQSLIKRYESVKDVSALGRKGAMPQDSIYVPPKLNEPRPERIYPMDEDEEDEMAGSAENVKSRYERKVSKRDRVLDADTAVLQFRRMAILGPAGAGKTSLLKHLVLKSCRENLQKEETGVVPVPVTVRHVVQQPGRSLRDYIAEVFEMHGFQGTKGFVERELKCGRCMLLLDGFDELAEPENRKRLTLEIHRFVELYPLCRIVVFSRKEGCRDKLEGFVKLELLEFDDSQVKQFIDNWFGESRPESARALRKAVKGNETIKRLARNPLMITIIAVNYEADPVFPRRRAELYRGAVDAVLKRSSTQENSEAGYTSSQKKFILGQLAYQAHRRNRRLISEETALKLVRDCCAQLKLGETEAGPVFEEIVKYSFLLTKNGEDGYEFLHISFQEYFAALELSKQEQAGCKAEIFDFIDIPWWEESVLFYAGIVRDSGPLVKCIQKDITEDNFYSRFLMAGKCIANAGYTDSDLEDEIAGELWSLYREGVVLENQGRPIEVLAAMKPGALINRLIDRLKDEDPSVRRSIAFALGELGSADAAPALYDVLSSDEDDYVRGVAAAALGETGWVEAVPVLTHALKNDPDGYLRAGAAEALRTLGDEGTVPALIHALVNDTNSYVRSSAADALGALRSPGAVQALINSLAQDDDIDVRMSAADALGMIASVEAVKPLSNALAKDETIDVRMSAADALGAINSRGAVASLVDAMKNSQHQSVRWIAAEVLRESGSPETVEAFIIALTGDQNIFVRRSAAEALGEIGSPEAIEPLSVALKNDRDSHVRGYAAEALGKVGDKSATPALGNALKDKGHFNMGKVKDAASEALKKIDRRIVLD